MLAPRWQEPLTSGAWQSNQDGLTHCLSAAAEPAKWRMVGVT